MASVLSYFHYSNVRRILVRLFLASQKPIQLLGDDQRLNDLAREMPMNCESKLCTRVSSPFW